MPEGIQLVKGCKDMIPIFTDIRHQLHVEYGVVYKTCPVGAHYAHGKVERKIQQIKKSISRNMSSAPFCYSMGNFRAADC